MEKLKQQIDKYINSEGLLKTPAIYIKQLFSNTHSKINDLYNQLIAQKKSISQLKYEINKQKGEFVKDLIYDHFVHLKATIRSECQEGVTETFYIEIDSQNLKYAIVNNQHHDDYQSTRIGLLKDDSAYEKTFDIYLILNSNTCYLNSYDTNYIEIELLEFSDNIMDISINNLNFSSDAKIQLPFNLQSISGFKNSNVTQIAIPESVTSIKNGAFANCSSLTSVQWNAKNCSDFGAQPFANCSQITSFTFGDNVEHIPSRLCYDLNNLTAITIPISVTYIGDWAFYRCSFTSITIPNSVTSIGNEAFQSCRSLTSITIPNSVTSIGRQAFYGCTSLPSITIPDCVTSIGNSAFSGCLALTSATVGKGVTSIGYDGFEDCPIDIINFNSINCTLSDQNILGNTFSQINFGKDVEYIPKLYSNNITSVVIPEKVKNVDFDIFKSPNLQTVYWNAINHPDLSSNVSTGYLDGSNVSTIIFGDKVEHIPALLCTYSATQITDKLKYIIIGESVKTIGNAAFGNNGGIEEIISKSKIAPLIDEHAFYPNDNNTFVTNKVLKIPQFSEGYDQAGWKFLTDDRNFKIEYIDNCWEEIYE